MKIEEMYKVYGVKPLKQYTSCAWNSAENCPYSKDGNCIENCTQLFIVYEEYPPFTAEKQLELIKYILTATTTDELRIYYSEILKCYVFHWYSIPELDMRDSCTTQNAEYELALAELVTMLKNELNHAKVKEILE